MINKVNSDLWFWRLASPRTWFRDLLGSLDSWEKKKWKDKHVHPEEGVPPEEGVREGAGLTLYKPSFTVTNPDPQEQELSRDHINPFTRVDSP